MQTEMWRRAFFFSLSVLLSIVLLWFGSRLLFVPRDVFSSTGLYVFAAVFFVCSVLLTGMEDIRQLWWLNLGLLLMGVYCLLRGAGSIQEPWLARIIGAASWLAVVILLYTNWPSRKRVKNESANEES